MVISIYEEIIGLEKASSQEIKDKLVQLNISHIFKHALEKYWEIFKPLVLYTAHTYSYDSKLLRLGMDWEKNKIDIALKCSIPEDQYDNIIRLKDAELGLCFKNFLFLYMSNIDFVHLINLKEIYQKAVMESKTASDAKDQMKYIKDAEELIESIETYELKVKNHYKLLNNPMRDFEHASVDNSSNPLKLENSPLII